MKRLLSALIVIVLLQPVNSFAASPKPGSKCSKVGASVLSKGLKFTCIKKSGKLVWSKGVAIKKPEVITQGICPAKSDLDVSKGITQKRANALLTMTEAESLDCANKLGWDYRIGQRDDEIFAVTMDYSKSRVTVTIKNGFITLVQVG